MPAENGPLPRGPTPGNGLPAQADVGAGAQTLRGRFIRGAIIVACGSILVLLFILELKASSTSTPGQPHLREFGAFYAVGYVLNRYPAARLYDTEFYQQVHRTLFPNAPANHSAPYGHAPFEAAVFRPFALLPYLWALRLWQATCLVLYSAGFMLLWRSCRNVPRQEWPAALLLFLSFNCVCMESVVRGQVNAIPFVFTCAALSAARRGADLASGLFLAVCICKPTLLLLIIPMLAATRQMRVLRGAAAGAALLGATSILVVGWEGFIAYLKVVLSFGRYATGASGYASPFYVDLNNFYRMLTGGNRGSATVLLCVTVLPVLLLLGRTWWKCGREEARPDLLWPLTLTWSMLLNLYATAYDTPIAIIGLLVTADLLYGRLPAHVPRAFWVVLAIVYVTSWCPALPLSGTARLQVFSLGLLLAGAYQLRLASTASAPASTGSVEVPPLRSPEWSRHVTGAE